jgi:WD40 repeat protein
VSEEAFAATPYKGLMPYSEEDAPFFFGRDAEREIITANLIASRLTLLYGPSGVGKSSVLRAGVAHHLRRLARENLDETGSPQFAIVVFNSWRDDPIAGLEARVRESAMQSLNGQAPVSPSRSLLEGFRVWTECLGGELLIILDQFEEYFLYHGQEAGAESFAAQFPRIVNSSDLNVHFLISIRDDALAKLDRFQGQIPTLFENRLSIDHLDQTAARAAIENPIQQYNRLYAAGRQRISIEPELVEAILDQVKTGQVVVGEAGRGVIKGQAAVAQIETPYLQLVMNRLWEEDVSASSYSLRLKTLETLGGAQRIVRTHLDAAMKALPQNEQDVAARVFHYLVTPSGTKIAHTIPDLAGYSELPREHLLPVMEKLSGGDIRILRGVVPPPDQPDEPRYEIFHDVLAPAILDWRRRHVQKLELAQAERRAADESAQREREATEMERAAARQRELEQDRALATEQQRRAEAERQRELERTRLLTGGLIVSGILVLIMVFLALIAFRQYKKARSGELAAHARENLQFDPELSILLAREAVRYWKTDAARDALTESLAKVHPYVLLEGHMGKLNSAAFSPDGELVATASADHTARIWDAKTGEPVAVLTGHEGEVRNATFSPDGQYVVTCSEEVTANQPPDTTARIWNSRTGRLVTPLVGHTDSIAIAIFSPDGTRIATEAHDGTGEIWDVKSGTPLFTLKDLIGPVAAIAFSPDGKRLVTENASDPDIGPFTAKVWDVTTGKPLLTLRGHSDAISAVAFSPDGKHLVTASWDKTARVWDATTGKEMTKLSEHLGRVTSVAVSPDSSHIATSSTDGTVKVWNMADGKVLVTLHDLEVPVADLAFSADGNELITRSGPGTTKAPDASATRGPDAIAESSRNTAKVWDMATGKELYTLRGHRGAINAVAFSPDGKYIVTASLDNTARVWDVNTKGEVTKVADSLRNAIFTAGGRNLLMFKSDAKSDVVELWDTSTGKSVAELRGQPFSVYNPAFSADGRYVVTASAGTGNTACVWETPTGKLRDLKGHTGPIYSVALSSDGKYAVTASSDKTARVWETSTGNPIAELNGHTGTVLSAALSADGKYVVTASSDRTARVWETSTGNTIAELKGHKGPVYRSVFSPDGKRVATASGDQTARIWEAGTGKLLTELKGHTSAVYRVVFSPDGKYIVTASVDNIARIWETNNGNFIAELDHVINNAVFSANTQWVVTTGDDRTVRVWEVTSGNLVKELRGHTDRVYNASFVGDSTNVITVSSDGTSRIYACDVCAPIDDLLKLVSERVTWEPYQAQRKKYGL